jgi:hypothetical protein
MNRLASRGLITHASTTRYLNMTFLKDAQREGLKTAA